MNRLDPKTRAQILNLLCEGQSIRAITRLTGASKNTVIKLLVTAGRACADYQYDALQNLPCKRIQLDEIWSFVYSKQDHVKDAKAAPANAGDAWTWTAICDDTKLLISTLVGQRNTDYALHFVDDLRWRLANRVQVTSDGHRPYLAAMDTVFGDDADYAMLVNPRHVSTLYAERQNLTVRMHMRRFTRLTNGFSKKLEHHTYAVALHQMYYNFVRIHQTLKVSPAMAAGVSDKLWEVADIVAMVETWEANHAKSGTVYELTQDDIGDGYHVRRIE